MKKKKTELFWYRECYRTKRFFSQFSEKERNGEREREKKKHTSIRMYNIYELHEQQKKKQQPTNKRRK